ncbi:MAG TPA: Reeler domain-containing protein [Bacteroidia bacterium]|nr:Reeler domain-containing protein [Bacteroidia bacterium]
MKNKIFAFAIILSVVIAIAASPERSSSGAPGAHTGAPGEQTCATSGCHDDNSINSGKASLSIEVGSSVTNYVPGKTYSIKVSMSEKNVKRFGFQLLALNKTTLSSVGTFQIADPGRTQLVKNTQAFSDREYVTYSFNGTDATSDGMSEWIVNWTAPSTDIGPVAFYAAGVSANDDMTDKKDHVYTSSKVLNN